MVRCSEEGEIQIDMGTEQTSKTKGFQESTLIMSLPVTTNNADAKRCWQQRALQCARWSKRNEKLGEIQNRYV